METLLSIKDYAMLTGISERHARRLAGNGQLQAQTVVNEKKRMEYRIPLSALPADAQKRYYAQQGIAVGAPPAKAAGKPFDHYTEAEREEIVWWEQKLAEWKKWRSRGGMSAAELDKRFLAYMKLEHPERELSIKTLYRKKKALETGNLDGLIDKRGQQRRGKTEIPDEVWRIYQSFLLQETKWQNIQDAIRLTEEYFQVNGPEYLPLASYSTFWRRTQEIPPQVRSLAIYGEKALKDDYTPYVRRRYQEMHSNEWWVADNHTFDVQTIGPDGSKHRLYLTAFVDARSGIFTGWHVSENPSAQSTLLALRKGALERGLPENLLTDNGSEFLAWDVGGRGHRTRKTAADSEKDRPPTIMQHLGIQFHCAQVKNAQAKPIERRFLDVKGQFSRLWATYTGGNVTEKPECLKKVLKRGELPTDAEFIEAVDTLIRGFFNLQKYTGPVTADRKYCREDVFAMRKGETRMATEEDLRLMMMRTTRAQKVGQRGVKVKLHGIDFEYFTQDFLLGYQNKKVYVRYDPDHMESCRVYSAPGDKFIAELPLDTKLTMTWNATDEEVAEAARYARQYTKRVKEEVRAARVPGIDQRTMLEVRLAAARKRMDEYTPPKSKAPIRMVRPKDAWEPPQLAAASGAGPDIFAMVRDAERQYGETEE